MIEEPAFYPWLTGRQNLQVLAATGGGCATAEFGRVLDAIGLSDAAGRLLAGWATRLVDGQFLVEHDSGREVNAVLGAGGVIAESVAVELPRLEDRFLEIVEEENTHAMAADS